MRQDTSLPLFYAAGAGLTELALALRVEPRVAGRLRLVWIGGMEYPDLRPGAPERGDAEYNTTIDTRAVQEVFDTPELEIWQIPRDTYRRMLVSSAELGSGLRGAGRLGRFLLEQVERARVAAGGDLGETYILGDSPLVTVTALQSSFEPDSSSSDYVVRPRPRFNDAGRYTPREDGRPIRVYTTIDARLTFADMFAKFAKFGRK